MSARLVFLVLLLAASTASAKGRAWISVNTLGMEDKQTEVLRARVVEQVRAAGAAPVGKDDTACLDDDACTSERTSALKADAVVDVRAVLAGDVAQLSIRLLDKDGKLLVRDQSVIEAQQLKVGLSDAVLNQLRSAMPTASADVDVPDPDPGLEPAPGALPTLGVAGLAITGVGLAMTVGGLAFAQSSGAVLEDPTSTAEEKEGAFGAGWASITVAIIGGLVAATGASLAFVGFAE